MARAKEGVTIGFLGTGSMDVDGATDLIEEYIEANITSDEDPVVFVFPLTTNEFSETMEELVDMAKKSEITYEVITSTSDKIRRSSFNTISADAARTYHIPDPITQLEHILTEAPKALLEVLWDAKREDELTVIIRRFMDAGIEVLDLTDGNSPFEDEVDNGDETKAEPEEAVSEATEEATEEETTETAETIPIYARSELEEISKKEGRSKIKDINVTLGLPPRKSTAAMIDQIMEAQGEPEEPFETSIEAAEAVVVEEAEGVIALEGQVVGVETTPRLPLLDFSGLTEAMEDFPIRLHGVLDEFLTGLGKTLEGVIFNASPEAPDENPPEEARPRRLSRR